MTDDWQLLERYAREHSEDAFATLVQEHLGLVYSMALRQVRDEELAKDITQMVFANLARRARALKPTGTIAGWLHRDTRFTALEVVRRERRRVVREQQAAHMQEHDPEASPNGLDIQPALDAALDQLGQLERDAVLLRFFEQRSLKQIGAALGLDEDAVRKRVARAVEKLRLLLSRQGVSVSGAALMAALTTQAVQAVPAGLAASVLTTSLAAGAPTVGAFSGLRFIETIVMTKLKATAITVAIAAGVSAPLVLQHQANSTLRQKNQALQAQTAGLSELQSENDRLSNRVAQLESGAGVTGNEITELLHLRGEVGLLRQQAKELAALQAELARLRAGTGPARAGGAAQGRPSPDEVAAAKATIFDPSTTVEAKLAALGVLRSANARSDDVVRQLVQVYDATEDAILRADIFRQLNGVTTPELKRPLLEAVSNTVHSTVLREEAAETLAGFLADAEVSAWLNHLAANDSDPKVRNQAAKSLAKAQRR